MQNEIINKAKDEIFRLTISIQKQSPFYSYIIMHMRCTATVDDSLPTGAVNASGDLFYNPIWFMGLNKDERIFFLLHEASHMALLSHIRLGKRDHNVWNIATDLIINSMLIDDGYKPIKDCLYPNNSGDYVVKDDKGVSHKVKVVGRTAEQIYEDLIKILPVIKAMLISGSSSENGTGTSYKGGFDGHIYETSDEGEEADAAGGNKIDENAVNDISVKWRRILASADIVAKQAGRNSSIQERCLDKILKPEINWKNVLHRFIQNKLPTDISMRRPGRRSAALGYYAPSVIKQGLHVVVAPDVSGSIGKEEYVRFMSEVHSILHSSNQIHMTIIPWAHTVLEEDVLDMPIGVRKDIMNYKIKNSGGTSIDSLGKYIEQKSLRPDLCVVFTDGYISESNPKPLRCTTLAVVNKGGNPDSLKKYATQVTCLDNEGI